LITAVTINEKYAGSVQ